LILLIFYRRVTREVPSSCRLPYAQQNDQAQDGNKGGKQIGQPWAWKFEAKNWGAAKHTPEKIMAGKTSRLCV